VVQLVLAFRHRWPEVEGLSQLRQVGQVDLEVLELRVVLEGQASLEFLDYLVFQLVPNEKSFFIKKQILKTFAIANILKFNKNIKCSKKHSKNILSL
jgi:hypothetical protein